MATRCNSGGAPFSPFLAMEPREAGLEAAAATDVGGEGGEGEAAPAAIIREGWFRETCSLWPGQALSLQVEAVLHHRRSRFQEILVFRR